ncbi:MAG: molybdenum cofactor guanylyltransferase [Alphaproteobacteria bacterium]|nr:molybdenum cofactor guanylyltransferase [Alphaproteobacteria bacterium]
MPHLPPYIAVILAGGAAERMVGQVQVGLKILLPLAEKTLLQHVTSRLAESLHPPQRIALNIVAEQRECAPQDIPIALDQGNTRNGPLAGIAASLDWCAEHHPEVDWVLTVSGDTPFLPPDLATRLFNAAIQNHTAIACAASNGRSHPPIAVWKRELLQPIKNALAAGTRKIDRFSAPYAPITVHWGSNTERTQGSEKPDDDPFFNVNRPEDLQQAQHRVQQ